MDGTATEFPDCIALSATADVPASVYGARAGGIVDLMRAKLPVPNGWVFSVDAPVSFGTQRSKVQILSLRLS